MKKVSILLLLFMTALLYCTPFSFAAISSSSNIFEGKPRINAPFIVGNYPSTPFLFAIPTSGERPAQWKAKNLPSGLILDSSTGIIHGVIKQEGKYDVKITVINKLGKCTKNITFVIGNNVALTPPMGWNSWNTFGLNLNEQLIKETADAIVNSGMRALGYVYVNIDDTWQLKERAKDGHIQIDTKKFPNGIKALADYLHKRGLKLGIYSDAAEYTCAGVCGSLGYETNDANDFAKWGVDLLKYDYCGAPSVQDTAIARYTAMGKALRATDRTIIYNICEWGQLQPWLWAKKAGGHYWRTTWDIRDNWYTPNYSGGSNGVLNIADKTSSLGEYAGPGGWNDPDMLIVGINGNSQTINNGAEKYGCSETQYRSHMSLWCMMSSPLLCGNDLRKMDKATLTTLMNPEIIAINQDPLGKQAQRAVCNDKYEIWIKPLADGSHAIACLNKESISAKINISFNELSLPNELSFRDIWEHQNIGKKKVGFIVKALPYECKVFIVK